MKLLKRVLAFFLALFVLCSTTMIAYADSSSAGESSFIDFLNDNINDVLNLVESCAAGVIASNFATAASIPTAVLDLWKNNYITAGGDLEDEYFGVDSDGNLVVKEQFWSEINNQLNLSITFSDDDEGQFNDLSYDGVNFVSGYKYSIYGSVYTYYFGSDKKIYTYLDIDEYDTYKIYYIYVFSTYETKFNFITAYSEKYKDFVYNEKSLPNSDSNYANGYCYNLVATISTRANPLDYFNTFNFDYVGMGYIKTFLQGLDTPTSNTVDVSTALPVQDVTINRTIINNYINGSLTSGDIEGQINLNPNITLPDLLTDLLDLCTDDNSGTGDNNNTNTEPVQPDTTPIDESELLSGTIDYTDILRQILKHCSTLDTNVADLYSLFKSFAGKDGCEYDFGELKNYLDKISFENEQSLANLDNKLATNNSYLQSVVERLDNIYEKLGGLNDYTEILDKIYEHISSGDYTLDDVVRSIDSFAEANGGKLDAVLTAMQTSNTYFSTLLDRLPEAFADGYDDEEIKKLLGDIIDDLGIMIDQNDEILNQLSNIQDLLKEDIYLKKIQDKAEQCAQKASEVFPTCVPWDLARLFNALAADPVTPVITIPIAINSQGITEEFTIDFSQFDEYAEKFRNIMTVVFGVGLMIFTLKYFSNKDT